MSWRRGCLLAHETELFSFHVLSDRQSASAAVEPTPIPTSCLFSIAAFRLAVKDMIGISQHTFGKMKGGAHKQATLIQNETIVCPLCFSCAILPKCYFLFLMLSDVFWRRQLWTSLRQRRQLPLCSHGNPLGGNNFAFIKFKVGLDCCWGGVGLNKETMSGSIYSARSVKRNFDTAHANRRGSVVSSSMQDNQQRGI